MDMMQRMARMEASAEALDRRMAALDMGQKEILVAMRSIQCELQQRKAIERVVGGVLEFVKWFGAAAGGAVIAHWLGGMPPPR